MNKSSIIMSLVAFTLLGCGDGSSGKPEVELVSEALVQDEVNTESLPVVDFAPVAAAFHLQAQSESKNMLNHCTALQADIQAFVQQPTEAHQLATRHSFLPCYQSWASVALFFQQPFDLADKKEFQKLIELIDTRPFLPGYIDGIPEYPFSGLVHELDIPINVDTLRSQHRLMDEESASVGFPVIEFFLWKMPVAEHWIATPEKENEVIVERRKEYLLAASNLLIDNLANAVLRWQSGNRFDQLPERAQLSLILKSLQRITMVELLAGQFDEPVFEDPEWHHPAPISGNGRSYSTIKLKSIQSFIGQGSDTPFAQWLAQIPNLNFTLDELRTALKTALTQVQTLPENYPFESQPDANWQLARQNLAQLALDLSSLSQALQVTVVTE